MHFLNENRRSYPFNIVILNNLFAEIMSTEPKQVVFLATD
jgi:hypothetical protein